MKKLARYAGCLFAALALTACDEDYTDWANPQTHPQENPAEAVSAVIQALPEATIDREQAPDTVALVSLPVLVNVPEGSQAKVSKLLLNESHVLPFVEKDGAIAVAVAQLDSLVEECYLSRAREERTLSLTVDASAITPDGQALKAPANTVEVKYLQVTPPALEDAYYILGDFCGWTADAAAPMTNKGNGVFELVFETTGAAWFKIMPKSAIVDGSVDWGNVYGSAVDSDTSTETFITWSNAQAFKVSDAGKYRLTVDMKNWRYAVAPVSAEIYMTGSAYGWTDWQAFVPVNGHDGQFWRVIYLSAGEEFKFAPQAGWGGDFGADQLRFEDHAGAGLSGTGNVIVANEGWYLLYLDATEKVLETYTPDVYLIGNTAGSWNIEAANLFSVPASKDGEFVSPAFVAEDEIRVCVHPKESVDWWRMEFIVLDGKIDYRGNGPDQARVKGQAGQRLYLNFTNGTGSVK